MSITVETAKAHAKDPAISCCRFEAGTIIEPSNLEDPAIFPDLIDSGLLSLPENVLNIEQVLGAKLVKTIDALTPFTAEYLDNVVATATAPVQEVTATSAPQSVPTPSMASCGSTIKLHIGEGKDIHLEIPLTIAQSAGMLPANYTPEQTAPVPVLKQEEKLLRSITRKHFKIDNVVFADETKIEGTTLFLRKPELIAKEAVALQKLVVDMKIDIITPDKYKEYSETIMDIQPIATKESGELGSGVTRVIDGVIIMVTGTDENGVQIGEFGSSEGVLETNIMWNRPGAPDKGEIFIKTQVTVKAGTNMERPGPLAAHHATDYVTQEIREALKKADVSLVVKTQDLNQYRRPGKKKIVVIKEIMGQGAMHDNLILPVEPVGTLGAKPNVDLGNLPIVMSPVEILDGGIHALTCIGPASKENSRHYFREPLVIEAMNDPEVDFVGVVLVGSPQINSEKFYVSKRLGMLIETMGVDGAIVTTEGFGNNHIDFASHIEEIGKRGISVVGVTYSAVQGALVVGNEYMKHMIDNNKSKQGIENEILSNNTLCPEDAVRAMAMLKSAMAGEEVQSAQRKWNSNVKQNNVELIEKATGKKIDLVENEQSLPMSEKRKTIYETPSK